MTLALSQRNGEAAREQRDYSGSPPDDDAAVGRLAALRSSVAASVAQERPVRERGRRRPAAAAQLSTARRAGRRTLSGATLLAAVAVLGAVVVAGGFLLVHGSAKGSQVLAAHVVVSPATAGLEEAVPPNSQHLPQQVAAQDVLQALQPATPAEQPQAAAVASEPADATVSIAAASPEQSPAVAAPAAATFAAPAVSGWRASSVQPAVEPAAQPAAGWAKQGAPVVAAASVPAAARPAPSQAPASAAPAPRVQPGPAAVVQWPVVGPITSFFGPSHPLGIDIGVNSGTPIRAAASGRIAYVGGDPCCSYGYHVDIDHGNGVLTRYGHMLYLPALTVGQPVRMGDIIGLVGSTGFSTGPHLHFEVRLNDMVVDPLLVLPSHP